jgi:hypothetical protein
MCSSKHGEQNKDYASGDSVKPLFLVDQDVFGSTKPDRTHWLTNVEIYKAVGSKVPAECIKGIQRIRDMWRIYMDNTEDRITLIVEGLNIRGRHTQNPRNHTLYPLYAFGWDFGAYRFIYLYVGEPVSYIGFGGTKHVLID